MRLQLAETIEKLQQETGKTARQIIKDAGIHINDFINWEDEKIISVLNAHYKQ